MAITRIKVSNFKSFDEVEVDLRPLNVVVGGNASGKSNFLEIFRFLRDLSNDGVENAVSLQGGFEYLMNMRIGTSRPITLEVAADQELVYRISLGPQVGSALVVNEEPARVGTERVRVTDGSLAAIFDISFLEFDPKLPKKIALRAGKADLEPDGSNLAIVLKNLLQDSDRRKSFILLLRDLLPFVEDLDVQRFVDQSLLISLRESFGGTYLPAFLLSDGTLQVIALILALYFEKPGIMVLEEPDRFLHPHLISRLASMLRDVSTMKQVVVTTHNPELVKRVELENLLLVHRGKDGFSHVSRPADSKELRVFLENNLGIEDVYVQNLLDIGHEL